MADYFKDTADGASCKIGKNITPGEGRTHKRAKQRIVTYAEKLGIVKILTRFNQAGKYEHPQRKKPNFIRKKYSDEAPKEYNNKNIAEICSDKIRKIKLCDKKLAYKKQDK